GMDANGPIGDPDAVEDYLRNLGTSDWGASLDVAVLPRKRKAKTAAREAANDAQRESKPPSPHEAPKCEVRDAKPSDVPQLVALMRELGHELGEKQVRTNL